MNDNDTPLWQQGIELRNRLAAENSQRALRTYAARARAHEERGNQARLARWDAEQAEQRAERARQAFVAEQERVAAAKRGGWSTPDDEKSLALFRDHYERARCEVTILHTLAAGAPSFLARKLECASRTFRQTNAAAAPGRCRAACAFAHRVRGGRGQAPHAATLGRRVRGGHQC